MLEAKTLFDAGKLNEAIQATIQYVKSKPTDMTARTFLFELSIFSGDFERAEKQLDVLGQQDANAMLGTLIYRQCIAAERKRQKVFHEGARPTFLTPDVPAHVEMLLKSLALIREGKLAEAREKLDEAETERTVHSGTLGEGTTFTDLRDYNDVTSSVLEVFLKGEYVWLPLTQISKLEIVPPQNLRDLCWTQANIEALDGTNGEVHIPTLYVDSYKHTDDQIRLGRVTDWNEVGEEIYFGQGMRLFWIDGADTPMLNLHKITFEAKEEEESAAAATEPNA